ncbi:MAG: hypothetical protein ACI9EZ_002204, partial [Halobacteriales archaeon]
MGRCHCVGGPGLQGIEIQNSLQLSSASSPLAVSYFTV